MRKPAIQIAVAAVLGLIAWGAPALEPSGEPPLPKAFIDGSGPDWKALGEADFVNVNCDPDTFTWKGSMVHCTGKPLGALRSAKPYTNFELVAQWRHLSLGGNSGIYVWSPKASLDVLKPGQLPQGIEIQVLDHGY